MRRAGAASAIASSRSAYAKGCFGGRGERLARHRQKRPDHIVIGDLARPQLVVHHALPKHGKIGHARDPKIRKAGGLARNRTGVRGFAVRCVTTPPRGRSRLRYQRDRGATRAPEAPPVRFGSRIGYGRVMACKMCRGSGCRQSSEARRGRRERARRDEARRARRRAC